MNSGTAESNAGMHSGTVGSSQDTMSPSTSPRRDRMDNDSTRK
jgi:hypothetical protein